MITEIYIDNLVIIDSVTINLTSGLNVITGETGSGKSILIQAIELLLGGRSSKDLVGNRGRKAVVEGVFQVSSDLSGLLNTEYGIDIGPGPLVVSRELFSDGKSIARINSRQVNLSVVREISERLINIHGQNQNQLLASKKNFSNILDSLSAADVEVTLVKLRELIKKIKTYQDRLAELDLDDAELKRRIDVLQYQIDDISSLDLVNLDEDELEREYKKLSNIREISEVLSKSLVELNSGDYSSPDVLTSLGAVIHRLESIVEYDSSLESYTESISSARYVLEDVCNELRNYIDTCSVDEERLDQLSNTISSLEDLKRKYGRTIDDILEFKNKALLDLEGYEKSDKTIDMLNKSILNLQIELSSAADALTNKRLILARILEDAVSTQLKDLNFPNSQFSVSIDKNRSIGSNGQDDIDFLVSFNRGQELKSLANTASGGELSRLMLAFKIIHAGTDDPETLIFDEIDTGISGRTAQIVGQKLSEISGSYQVILVTHLPQIAVMGENHILIEKKDLSDRTITTLRGIDGEERIDEIARLIGGLNISEVTRLSAAELLKSSKCTKNEG